MRNHELISVFYKKQCTYNPQKTYGHKMKKSYRSKDLQTEVYGEMKNDYTYESTERYPRSIQVFSTDTQNSSLHPTQKPVAVLKRLIEIFTDPGDVVIDPCAGSGTTLRAAYELGRSAFGFEIDRNFYQRAKDEMLNFAKEE